MRAKEVTSLIGSKEGIANMAVAYVDPGDLVLATDPAYPVYQIGTQFNGGKIYHLPLRKENRFLPDLKAIPTEVARQAKMLWFGYPNNPTAAVADKEFFSGNCRVCPPPPDYSLPRRRLHGGLLRRLPTLKPVSN